ARSGCGGIAPVHRRGGPMPDVNRQWILRERPKGRLGESDFQLREAPVPEPGPGEALTRTLYISVDAANRAWMSPVRTYIDPVEPGGVMRAMTLGLVVRSNDDSLRAGDVVEGMAGWQEFAVIPARQLRRVERRRPLSIVMSGIGVTSLTAYFGLLDVGRPEAGGNGPAPPPARPPPAAAAPIPPPH